MEAQLQLPSHGNHHHEEDPQNAGLHSVMEGEGEGEQHHHHGEKKSVLKKVKDKAKKIKDTIKKHGHGHEHEDEDNESDEEMVNDHEAHGAPMYESTVIRSVNLPKEANLDIKRRTDTREEGENKPSAPGQTSQELRREKPNIEFGPPVGLKEDPNDPKNHPSHIQPSNYQSKVADPTEAGGKEAEVAPLVRQFDNLNVGDDSGSKPEPEQRSHTGSHDQFAPQPTPIKGQFNPESSPGGTPENPELNPKNQDPSKSQDTIAGKISSTASAIADKALTAKNVVASKLGYGVGSGSQAQEGQDSSKKPASESAMEYAHIAAEKLAPVYEKVAGAGSAVMSKVQGGSGAAEHQGGDAGPAKGSSVREYLAEKFRPGDEDKALSEAITDTFSKKKGSTGKERPRRKVTESEEVAARLGTTEESKREGQDAVVAGEESSGQGVVDRLRNAVGVWLGKSTGMQTSRDSVAQSYVSDAGSGAGGAGQG